MMLIKVTNFTDRTVFWINGEYVLTVTKGVDHAVIHMVPGQSFHVSESMDEVVAMLAGEDDEGE